MVEAGPPEHHAVILLITNTIVRKNIKYFKPVRPVNSNDENDATNGLRIEQMFYSQSSLNPSVHLLLI